MVLAFFNFAKSQSVDSSDIRINKVFFLNNDTSKIMADSSTLSVEVIIKNISNWKSFSITVAENEKMTPPIIMNNSVFTIKNHDNKFYYLTDIDKNVIINTKGGKSIIYKKVSKKSISNIKWISISGVSNSNSNYGPFRF